jgi:hypothetical protein
MKEKIGISLDFKERGEQFEGRERGCQRIWVPSLEILNRA